MNAVYAENRIRSTIDPEISAAVMIAKVPWNPRNSACGMVPLASIPTPLRNAFDRSPSSALPEVKASEYPRSAQATPTNPSEMKLIIIVLSAFFERTSPP